MIYLALIENCRDGLQFLRWIIRHTVSDHRVQKELKGLSKKSFLTISQKLFWAKQQPNLLDGRLTKEIKSKEKYKLKILCEIDLN